MLFVFNANIYNSQEEIQEIVVIFFFHVPCCTTYCYLYCIVDFWPVSLLKHFTLHNVTFGEAFFVKMQNEAREVCKGSFAD